MTRAELTTLLEELKRREGSALGLARLLGYSEKASNHIPDLLRTDNPIQPSVPTCLRIAMASGIHPSVILSAAGYEDVVSLLERSYAALSSADRPKADTGAVAPEGPELMLLNAFRLVNAHAPNEAAAWVDLVLARKSNLEAQINGSPVRRRPGVVGRPRRRSHG